MGRPSGWDVVDHGSDPVPGEPASIRSMAREYQRISDAADDASTRLKSVKGSGWLTDWQGDAADVFVDAIKDTPSDLTKLVDSYAGVATALSSWADVVDDTQYTADNALFDAKDAAGDLSAAQSRLSTAQTTLSHYQTAASTLSTTAAQYPAGSTVPDGVDVPTPAQLRAASDNTSVAAGAVSSAQGDIAAAQSRIEAAKRLVNEARGDWENGEHRTATKIGDAADAGLGKQSFWNKVFHSEIWEDIVTVAKVVVAVGGIIALVIGGPLVWIVFAAAVLVLADTLYKMSQGQADGWDLAFALLDCIPGGKGITTAARLGKAFSEGASVAGKFASAGRHLGTESRALVLPLQHLANNVRHGAALRSLESMRAAVTVGIPAAARDVKNAKSAYSNSIEAYFGSDVPSMAARARHWQGTGYYPGVDPWVVGDASSIVGKRLQVIGDGEFYVVSDSPANDLITHGGNAAEYSAKLQVGVHDASGSFQTFRTGGSTYEVTAPIEHASGTAVANSQYGVGGAGEVFIPGPRSDIAGSIRLIDTPTMDASTVHPLPDTMRMEEYPARLHDAVRTINGGIPWDAMNEVRHDLIDTK